MKPQPRLDPIVHAPTRLQLCAILASVDEAEFAALRDALGVSDSVLSKQLKVLEDAGYVKLKKTTIDSRVRTRAWLTKAGRRAFSAHVAEFQRIVANATVVPGRSSIASAPTSTGDVGRAGARQTRRLADRPSGLQALRAR
ncbi:MAG: transcriptional regulator [Solirubrobacterales bacterium]|nr:transcriptional regulator [Solirubrobacterales bacterium]